ncbi:SMI1/KNR4 family protein [Streptomyces sp. NPDC033754]|uniref:SMI1/KNR4 family protein n=1 Tax=unclassified Streptomyces TaxID=2593676 RepID=UPI0033CB830C
MSESEVNAFDHAWGRFRAWLGENSPADRAALRPPATEEDLVRLEKALGLPLHPQVRALLRSHDGAEERSLAPDAHRPAGAFLPLSHRLLGVDEILDAYEILAGVGEDNIDADLWDDDELAVNLHRCLPVALPRDGGFAFVDHRQGPTYGHVHEMGIGSGDLTGTLWGTSLAGFFGALTDALEGGEPFLYYRPSTYEHPSGAHCLEWAVQVATPGAGEGT